MQATNLLILSPVAERGGAERVMVDTLKYLNRSKFHAKIVFFEQGSLVEEMRSLGYAAEVLDAGRLRDVGIYVRVVGALRGLIRQDAIDVVVSWMPKAHLYGGIAALLEGKKSIWWQHMIPKPHWMDRIASKIPAHGVLCPSRVSKHFQEKLTPKKRVMLNNLGVDLEQFGSKVHSVSDARAKMGLREDAVVFAFVGRLQRWKRPDVVIRAFNEAARGKNAYLLIIGGTLFGLEQEFEQELKQLAEVGDPSKVIFLGHQKDVGAILEAADTVVHASLMEPFGMVIIESMAAQKAVIAVGQGGPVEIITNGDDGFLYDGSQQQLVHLMGRILDGQLPLEEMGRKARLTVEKKFTVTHMAERFESNIRFILN
ncbi:glycosyltransferase [Paenibacillus allorhizosphaerae]|uniref:D-inositol-3-phosphate glycosyltransferase n=1 Tax=Paenibacillus allorhizosphaerae TaxID=2849866 RepID=A0ABM8VET7_9BACL|nr:glycosyltransferase [Paenibacillus allorhizosphaerae]CAG7632658.1 D-inositol-3-phosphate glycosyltransferase [Paenibacillus allorhizosphaerae]